MSEDASEDALVKRLAEAIYAHYRAGQTPNSRWTDPEWTDLSDYDRLPWLAYARAVLPIVEEDCRHQLDQALSALADCVVKATPYGKQDAEFIAYYISPTGPIHRAIPLLAEHGIVVRPGFDGRNNSDDRGNLNKETT